MNINLPLFSIMALFVSIPFIIVNIPSDNQNINMIDPAENETTQNQVQQQNLFLVDENIFTVSSDNSGIISTAPKDSVGKGSLIFNMPIFVPDSVLTSSMPVLIPPPVDEGMIIPIP